MLSSPTPADRRPARGLVSSALRSVGLIDRDTQMRDASKDRAGGKKTTKKIGHRNRALDLYKDAAGPSRSHLLASRIAAADPLSIRGASRLPVGVRKVHPSQSGAGPSGSNHRAPTNAVDVWREFVKRRWNEEARYLNLERMVDDEILKKHNIIPPGLPNSSPREMAVIFKIASQLKPNTISLAHNSFESGRFLSNLAHYLPRLSNLSLQGNNLRTWKDLDYISGRRDKLSQLRELILIGNPVRELEYKNNRGENYRTEITRRFPALEVLDQEAVARISFNVPLASKSASTSAPQPPSSASYPLPMAPSFITGVEDTLISNFLVRFFGLFDTQRAVLADVYAQEATFSFSVITVSPPRARMQRLSRPSGSDVKANWMPWLNSDGGSRNLTRLGGGLDRTIKSLHIGPDEIVKTINSLPLTKHEVGGSPEKFCIDAWPIQQGEMMLLFVTVHGEFVELPMQTPKSFDRSLILAPAQDGSRAKLAQWDVVIISDQFVVRTHSDPAAWRPGPLKTQYEGSVAVDSQAPSSLGQSTSITWTPEVQARITAEVASIPEPQRGMILAISQKTGLNVKFSIDCLEGNGWDIDRAILNFEQVKGTLARDAFL